MEPIRHVKEGDFELIVELSGATYRSRGREIVFSYSEEGLVRADGNSEAFEELYALLQSRSELRLENYAPHFSLDPEKTDEYTTEEEAALYKKFLRINIWLGMRGGGVQ